MSLERSSWLKPATHSDLFLLQAVSGTQNYLKLNYIFNTVTNHHVFQPVLKYDIASTTLHTLSITSSAEQSFPRVCSWHRKVIFQQQSLSLSLSLWKLYKILHLFLISGNSWISLKFLEHCVGFYFALLLFSSFSFSTFFFFLSLNLLVVLNALVKFLYSSSCTDLIINVNAILCLSIFVGSQIERLLQPCIRWFLYR